MSSSLLDRNHVTCDGAASVVRVAAYLFERPLRDGGSRQGAAHHGQKVALSPGTPYPRLLPAEEIGNVRVQRRAMLLFERNIGALLSVKKLAEHTHLKLRLLERLFRLEIGISPSSFALRVRLQADYGLLTATTASISETAPEGGFSEWSHFSRSFHKRCRETQCEVRNDRVNRDPCGYRVAV